MSLAAAPDLIAPVAAFRAWRVVDDRLMSPYIPCRWEGRDGLRAQHARVCALVRAPRVQRIADALGVEVIERDELLEAAARYGAPLPASMIPR
jgi:hypothetical protein